MPGRAEAATIGRIEEALALVITITSSGEVIVGARPVHGDAEILAALRGAVAHGITSVRIVSDKSAAAAVVHIADLCKQAGFTKVAVGRQSPR